MNRRYRFALWLGAVYASGLAVIAAMALVAGAGLPADVQAVLLGVLDERAPALFLLAGLLLLLCGAAVAWFFRRYVTAAEVLAGQTQLLLGANPDYRVGVEAAPDLAPLAAAINRLAGVHRDLLRDFDLRAREAGAKLEEERKQLAALMSELSEGVLVCNADGRILLYNEQAKALFAAGAPSVPAGLVGLGRSLFALIDREQLAHALEKLRRLLKPGVAPPATRFVTATAAGRLLRVRAAPFVDTEGAIAGLVLALEDVTALLDQEARRRSLLQAFAAGVRAPVANMRAAAENLVAYPDMDAARRGRFVDIVAAESAGLSETINRALREHADTLKASLSLEDIRAREILEVARQRVESALGIATELGAVDDGLWLRADSFALVQAFAFLAGRLREDYGVRSLRFSARAAAAFAEIDMEWGGAIVASDSLSLWETEPMHIGAERSPLTLRDVLERHGGEAWMHRFGPGGARSALFRFLVPAVEAADAPARASPAAGESRPEYYDFDLFRESDLSIELHDRRLSELAYTVFDTETTGLEPSAGDEIISIGAVRILNGRLLKNEAFEQLVNPRRPLSREAVRIHGIAAEALEGQPAIDQVLPSFHRYCEETVLVGHNAAFDMRFLELKEASSGVKFAQPVLDTLLLSAVVHPGMEDHKLESVAERLGVRVIGRHTALGDALMTGEVFLRLVTLLAERGIVTLGEAQEASRQTYYARLHY